MKLRPYQGAAIEAIRSAFLRGDRATLLHLATGLGKTVVAAAIVDLVVEKGGRVLFIAHRLELLKQAVAKLEAAGVRAGIEQGRRRAARDVDCVVASVQTMQRQRLESWPADAFSLVIVDEAHHAAAKTYRNVLDRFAGAGRARVLGLTATPFRSDDKDLTEVFASIAYSYGLQEGIADGWLSPIVPRRVIVESVDLDGISVRAGDFAAGELDNAYSEEAALHAVARPLLEQAGDQSTLVFAAGVRSAHALAEVINGYKPGAAVALDGKTDEATRIAEVSAYAAGERQILVNAMLFVEGTDLPRTSCVAIARPTLSEGLIAQMVGRGTRLSEGKTDCLVLDFVGLSEKRQLATPLGLLAPEGTDREVLAEAMNMLDSWPDLEIEAALQAAEAAIRDRRRHEIQRARVAYVVESVERFLGPAPALRRWHVNDDPPNDGQLAELERRGFKKLPKGFSTQDAATLIAMCEDRDERGLCSLKQARLISNKARQKGVRVDVTEMSKGTAGRIVGRLMQDNYSTPGHVIARLAEQDNEGGEHVETQETNGAGAA